MTRDRKRHDVRVVHVSSAHPASDPRIYEKQCATLARAGYDVRLIATGHTPPNATFPVVAYRRSDRRLTRSSTPVGVARAILRALLMRPSIVHLHDPELLAAVPLLRLLGVKVVFDAHEHIAASMANKTYLPVALRRTARRAAAGLVLLADPNSLSDRNGDARDRSEFHNERTAVIQNSHCWRRCQDDVAQRSAARLVFIGGISEGRGVFQMLEAIEQLGDSHGARLTLAGTVPPELLARMQEHPGWRHAEFLGSLDRPAWPSCSPTPRSASSSSCRSRTM